MLSWSHVSFLIPPPTLVNPNLRSSRTVVVCCSCSEPQSPIPTPLRNNENKLGKLAMVAVAVGVLTLGSINVGDASAAKTGGRVGGQAFRSSAPPRNSAPRINNNNSRTNIYVNPRVAPPLGGGYGYGVPYYGGYGWSPFSFFAPGPSVAVGIGGGFESIFLFILLGAAAAVVRRFLGSRNDDDDDDY
ncbi:uncharacterized protein [Cicer arietinum]|uniref:Uncharacterized protein LOC101501731 n=1 Tax=Cicer arietinum TaxID=3827 RepID=A0A1S2YPD7_CICAR|nr:uncharacterized protein LOC101501731 [Cicer arietinum]